MKKLLLLMCVLLTGVSGAWAITRGNYYIRNTGMSTNLYLSSSATCVAKASAQAFLITPVDGEDGYYTISCQISEQTKYLKFYEGTNYKMTGDSDNSTVKLDGTSASDDACKWKITSPGANEQLKIWPKGHESGTATPRVLIQFTNTEGKCAGLWDNSNYGGSNWALTAYNTLEEQVIAGTLSSEIEVEVAGTTGTFSRTGGGSSNWKDLWTSSATGLKVQITTPTEDSGYRYNMAWTGSSQQLQMASGQDNKTSYYTITAPYGWLITGYKINGTTNGALTVDLADETSPQYASGATLTNVGVTGLSTKQTSFTLRGENKTITGTLHVKMKRSVMKPSDISTTKCYTLSTKDDRGYMYVPASTTIATTTTKSGVAKDQSSEAQQFAFVYYDADGEGGEDGHYYLYSISEKKFISKDGNYTKLTRTAEDYVTIEQSDIKNYLIIKFNGDWGSKRVNFSDGHDYGIYTNYETVDDGNRLFLDEAGPFNPTEALDTWNTRDVTYELYYNNSKVDELEVIGEHLGVVDEIPAELDNGFMTYTYTPSMITSETATVRVDATWNGPFQYTETYDAGTAKWYTVGIHTDHEGDNHIWKNDDGTLVTEAVATNAYGSINDNKLFCFVGDPYTGFSIYNKAAGSTKTVYKSTTQGDNALIQETGSLFMPKASRMSGKTVANGYSCFLLKGQSDYLNCNDNEGKDYKIFGWNDNDNGSTCWFIAPSQYPYNYLNGFALDAPNGAVGTVNVDAPTWANAASARTYLAANPFYYAEAANRTIANGVLDALAGASDITLSNGYYRVISAVPGFNHTAAWYYNPSVSADHITWAKAATTSEHQVNSIFKFESSDENWNIKSPNAQKYLIHDNTGFTAQTGTIGDEPGTVYVNAIGSAQHTLRINVQTIHANGHDSGAGTSGTLINWNANDPGAASTWYIVPVTSVDISLSAVGEYTYSTLGLPFGVTLPANVKAYILTEENGWAVPTEISEVPAGTGVLLRGTSSSVTSATLTIKADASAGIDISGNKLRPTYVDITANRVDNSGEYILGNDATDGLGFYQRKSGRKIGANKAYLKLDADLVASVKGLLLRFDDETGVNDVRGNKEEGKTDIFNLAGQRLSRVQKGVNIVNGKKVLIK